MEEEGGRRRGRRKRKAAINAKLACSLKGFSAFFEVDRRKMLEVKLELLIASRWSLGLRGARR